MFHRKDWIVGLVSIIIGAVILFDAMQWKGFRSLDPAGPAAMPAFLAWGIIIIGIIHLVAAWRAPKEAGNANAKSWIYEYKPVLQITLVCAIYNLLLEPVGYLIMTPLLIIGIMWVFAVRDIKRLMQTSFVATLILFTVFHYGLSVKFPMGILGGLIR
jgi:putative tricarboxylic transport membrane protein